MGNELPEEEKLKRLLLAFKKRIEAAYGNGATKLFQGMEKKLMKSLLINTSEAHLKYLLENIGLEKENYELCQVIKEVLEERETNKG